MTDVGHDSQTDAWGRKEIGSSDPDRRTPSNQVYAVRAGSR